MLSTIIIDKIHETCLNLYISTKNFIFLNNFNPEFLYIEVWFTNQNSKPLEIEDKINITLVIN